MFGVILIIAVALMQAYVFWRASSVPFVRRYVSRKGLVLGAIVLWLLFLLGRFSGGEMVTRPIGMALEVFGMTWLGALFLTSVALLAVDVVTCFGFLLTRLAPTLRGAGLIVGGMLAAIALVQGMRVPVVKDYAVDIAGLPADLDGTVIVALSDLHLGSQLGKPWLDARVAQVQALHPDAIVILGDVFEGHSAPDQELFTSLRHLSAPLGVWAVLGNHEFHGANSDAPVWFKEAGFHPLRNSWIELRPGLVLAGIEDPTLGHQPSQKRVSPARVLAERPPCATILLSHAPLSPEAVSGIGVDLILSGHTHGGQIWPFGYLVQQGFPLIVGQFHQSGTTVIVSRGTGTWGPRMRLWQPGEIVRVSLHMARSIVPER